MRPLIPFVFAAALAAQDPAAAPTYEPLQTKDVALPPALELDVVDRKRDRTIPIRVQLPTAKTAAPVVLWSHGLGGTRETCRYLADHWAARGYVVVSLQHPGSDDSVWRGEKPAERIDALREAASGKNLLLRCGDVSAVLDQLAAWNTTAGHTLAGRIDLEHVGMSGHSFGAITTQVTAGQNVPLLGRRLTDPRIDAALPMSPAAKERQAASFAEVAVPWLVMTGTEDTSPINDTTVEDRLRVYPSLPATIDRYELVLDGGRHDAFTDGRLLGDRDGRRNARHQAILALSMAFWDTHLRGNGSARAWLHGDGPRQVLDPKDRWQEAHPAAATAPAK